MSTDLPTKLFLHDFGGYSFPYELASELHRRNYRVEHVYCASNPATPISIGHSDEPQALKSSAISLGATIDKKDLLSRYRLETRYGNLLATHIRNSCPDIVLLANTPLEALGKAITASKGVGAASIVWLQDLLGDAATRVLSKRYGRAGLLVGRSYAAREQKYLRQADYIVSITDDFAPYLAEAGIRDDRWITIPNWAPLDQIRPEPKTNPWSIAHGLHDKAVLLYSGSLGAKHNPRLLLKLADAIRHRKNTVVVVNSEGEAANWLRTEALRCGLSASLRVNSFQPYERLSEVLASADVLLANLEPSASQYSVPSKVLCYLCAGRPQIVAVPADNLAAKIVTSARAGLVCDPEDADAFIQVALSILDNPTAMSEMGENARAFAMHHFRIDRIADRFDTILENVRQELIA